MPGTVPIAAGHADYSEGTQIHVNISLAVITKTGLQNFPKSASDNFK